MPPGDRRTRADGSDDAAQPGSDELLALHRWYKAAVMELRAQPRGTPGWEAAARVERDLALRIFALIHREYTDRRR